MRYDFNTFTHFQLLELIQYYGLSIPVIYYMSKKKLVDILNDYYSWYG